jgi:glycogen(starch) synthase
LHAKNKEAIHEFVRGHFFGHYHFELDNTLYFFTAGRLEYRNKGVDMFIESLSRNQSLNVGLNYRLKQIKSNMTVVCFIIMPAPNNSYTAEALRGQAKMKQLRQTVSEIQHSIGQRIFDFATKYEFPD